MTVYITPLHTVNQVRFKPFQGVLINAALSKFFFLIYLVVNSVKGVLQINKDYAIKKTSINMDKPAIVYLQQGSKRAL